MGKFVTKRAKEQTDSPAVEEIVAKKTQKNGHGYQHVSWLECYSKHM